MDTRGIEVTNQLRSAIRAKLMELGVRYDEELPDYILVMVVNKKSRQQMHDDLNLFLEDCTTVFVDWLHDQVLKKLQKVTVAKKKSSREFVPTVVVKQEEERKKKKVSATSFLEDQTTEQVPTVEKFSDKSAKSDKQVPAQKPQALKSSVSNQNPERSHSRSAERSVKVAHGKGRTDEASSTHGGGSSQDSSSSKKPQQTSGRDENARSVAAPENPAARSADSHGDPKESEAPIKSLKRPSETSSTRHDSTERKSNEVKRPRLSEEAKEDTSSSPDTASRKLKSCVNKPRITSVVSVKNRLGIVSPRKKFESYRQKEGNGRYRPPEKRFEKPHRYDNGRGGKGRNFETDDRGSRRNRDGDSSRHHEQAASKVNDVRSRIESSKSERLIRNVDSRDRSLNSGSKTDASAIKSACTIKNRLGIAGINSKAQRQSSVKSQETADYRNKPKSSEQTTGINNKNIKDRLGPLRSNFRLVRQQSRQRREDDESLVSLNPVAERDDGEEGKEVEDEEEEEEEEADDSEQLIGPVKSHIVAVRRSAATAAAAARIERKRMKTSNEIPFGAAQSIGYLAHGAAKSQLDKTSDKGTSRDVDEEDADDTRLPSKVIVTPRPLKPLQPTQKRATQSLLLRAVAEANQSVVTQKNPEPSLFEKKPVLKRLKPAPARDVSQNLSVHFNSSKRLVMEKIQVELNTIDHLDVEDVEPEPYVPQPVTDEHMGVVMSLFQRSDDNQKFLVTLNGYNNNLMKEKISSEDDEERLEMEVNEDDELALLTTHNEATAAATATTTEAQDELEIRKFRIAGDAEDSAEDASPKEASGEENNENCNTENVDKIDETPRRRRKLSPIVYNRSHSPSPTQLKSNASLAPTLAAKLPDKKPLVENPVPVVLDKSRENCRYWPNCTLGNKCAYLHPPVMCSAFPACKFGDKCAYKHPKCKFGLSCTKLGCVFSHPAQQCKYHPFCTKPACPYSHPVASAPATEATSQRAKFTWRRRD
ncbi:PREDICTED: zinc finger CCCH domain-containing protein 14 [Wasmannia auropunctata]|uniref:zinc finger CCCH domain-containing protein 14 n=1 Tax=Wasmannia auropunctata TaxID=64793 RepID=UPI0005F04500|nr:PREDICTED: zinc finger CCCH domain-containing protein 14 [Wasmannia auropunctata]